ncbi:MAG: hypothetical protein H7288_12065 [Kineosporiaceae bacterium]|nr:hypothetical protein [Aeromicrobium sp.]
MITLLIIAAALVGIIFGVAAILPNDGYGHRPVPRSHVDSYPTHNPFL